MDRKFLFFFSIFIIFIARCGKEEKILTFAVGGAPSEVEYWDVLINEFEEKTKIKVKLVRQPTDTDQRRQGLVIPLKAHKEDPDVFLMDVIWVAQFAASDWLLPIDSYIGKNRFDLNSFFTEIIQQVDIYNQKLIALPIYNDCGILYYRKDILKENNLSVPKTWEELIHCAITIQAKKRKVNPKFYGFVWQGAQYEGLVCNFLEFATAHNGGIIDKNGKIKVNCHNNIEALQFMRDLIHKYKISPPNTFTEMKEEEVRLFFDRGDALFERNWPYALSLHQREGSPIQGKVGVTILPKFRDGENAAALGGWHIGISKYSDNKDAAWELLKFIVSYDTQKKLALHLGWNPGRRDIYNDTLVRDKMPQIEILKKSFENTVARPNLPYYTQISEILQRELNSSLSGEITPEEALKNSQKEIERIIKAYHE
jgi:multiple sugar transport system substrate-binding protein